MSDDRSRPYDQQLPVSLVFIARIQFREHLLEDIQIDVYYVQFASKFSNLLRWQMSNDDRTTAAILREIGIHSALAIHRRHGRLRSLVGLGYRREHCLGLMLMISGWKFEALLFAFQI